MQRARSAHHADLAITQGDRFIDAGTRQDNGGWVTILQVSGRTTVDELKVNIEDTDGTPVVRQRLVYGGVQLEGGRTLLECGMEQAGWLLSIISAADLFGLVQPSLRSAVHVKCSLYYIFSSISICTRSMVALCGLHSSRIASSRRP